MMATLSGGESRSDVTIGNVRVRITERPDGLVLYHSRRNFAIAGFLAFWLCGWSVGCSILVSKLLEDPQLENMLFATPFFVGEVAVALALPVLLLASESLRLTPEGLVYRYQVLLPLSTRRARLADVRRVATFERTVTNENRVTHEWGIEITTRGYPIRFGQGISREEAERLARQIEAYLAQSLPDSGGKLLAASELPASGSTLVSVLGPPEGGTEPPETSLWRCRRDWDNVRFRKRLPWSLMGVLVMLGLCGFWNGIVGVFLAQLFKQFQVGLFLFLIPFELIGLLFFVGLFWSLTVPLWSATWTFSRHEARCRWGGLGFGWTWRYPAESIVAVELHFNETQAKSAGTRIGQSGDGSQYEGSWRLAFVGDPERLATATRGGIAETNFKSAAPIVSPYVFTIASLTEAEAQWFHSELYQQLPEWFR